MNLPNTITNIAKGAFFVCPALTTVNIPNSVTSIGENAFAECTQLTSIVIPNSVTSLGTNVFTNCTSLATVTISNNIPVIKEGTFSGCSSLTTVTIPNSVKAIDEIAFLSCTGLKSINLPNTLTSIGSDAFSDCESLTSLEIPNSVTTLGDYMFNNCSALESITLPDTLSSLPEGFFNYCSSLTSITIPSTVKSIGTNAFCYCQGLRNINSKIVNVADVTMGSSVFSGVSKYNCTLTVPQGTVEAYKNADQWNYFENIVADDDTTQPTGAIVFSDLEVEDDHCTFSVSYTGNEEHQLTLKVNGEAVENPFTIARTNSVQQLTVVVEVQFTNPNITTLTETILYEIPAIEVVAPFVTTPSPTTLPIHWYQLKVNDKYVYYDPNGGTYKQIKLTPTASSENNFLWCFVQASPDKIVIYNRAAQQYLKMAQYLNTDITDSYLSYVEEKDNTGFYIKYYHEGDNHIYYLYESIGEGYDNLSSVGASWYAGVFNAIEIEVEENLVPVNETTLTPYDVHTPNNAQTDPAEDYYKLFDKDRSTKWCVDNNTGAWETIWVDFKSNTPFRPAKYTMTIGNDTYSWSGRNPKKWKIYAKAKESDSWTTIVDVSDGAAAGLGTANTTDYSFDIKGINTEYQYFRFEVTEVRGKGGWHNDHYVFQLAELALSGYTPGANVNGDVNGDFVVDVKDVTALIQCCLGKTPNGFVNANADLNDDGEIDVKDVTALINLILK